MKYETLREVSPQTLVARSEDGREVLLDKVDFAITLRENVRFEVQTEIQKRIEQARNIHAAGLLKYSAFVKHQDQLCLVREMDGGTWQAFEPERLGEVCRGLLTVLHVIQAFHRQGVVVGGLSRGLLKWSNSGGVVLQEPWVLNYVSKWLDDESYLFELAPEVIRGGSWGQPSDLFSWGVLAYQLVTGRHPFFAEQNSDRIAQVLRGKVAAPKDYCPRLSNELNQMIVQTLSVDPSVRPELDTLIAALAEQIEQGTYEVSEIEAEQYTIKAENRHKQHQFREKTWLWFRRYGRWASVVTICMVVMLVMTFGFRAKPLLSRETSPRAVISYYFQGAREINVSLMLETLHHAKNSLDEVVSNIHVMNMQGVTVSTKAKKIQLRIDQVKTVLLLDTEKQVKYKVYYEFEVIFPNGKGEAVEREDEFTLEPIHRNWKITHIKILKEKHLQKKVTTK